MNYVVLIHKEGAGYEVEFTATDGSMLAVVTLLANQVRTTDAKEIANSRLITQP